LKVYDFFALLLIVFSCNSNAISIENRSSKIVHHEKTFIPVSKTDYFDNVTSANLTIASTRAVEMNEYLFYIALVENEPFPYVIRKGGKAPIKLIEDYDGRHVVPNLNYYKIFILNERDVSFKLGNEWYITDGTKIGTKKFDLINDKISVKWGWKIFNYDSNGIYVHDGFKIIHYNNEGEKVSFIDNIASYKNNLGRYHMFQLRSNSEGFNRIITTGEEADTFRISLLGLFENNQKNNAIYFLQNVGGRVKFSRFDDKSKMTNFFDTADIPDCDGNDVIDDMLLFDKNVIENDSYLHFGYKKCLYRFDKKNKSFEIVSLELYGFSLIGLTADGNVTVFADTRDTNFDKPEGNIAKVSFEKGLVEFLFQHKQTRSISIVKNAENSSLLYTRNFSCTGDCSELFVFNPMGFDKVKIFGHLNNFERHDRLLKYPDSSSFESDVDLNNVGEDSISSYFFDESFVLMGSLPFPGIYRVDVARKNIENISIIDKKLSEKSQLHLSHFISYSDGWLVNFGCKVSIISPEGSVTKLGHEERGDVCLMDFYFSDNNIYVTEKFFDNGWRNVASIFDKTTLSFKEEVFFNEGVNSGLMNIDWVLGVDDENIYFNAEQKTWMYNLNEKKITPKSRVYGNFISCGDNDVVYLHDFESKKLYVSNAGRDATSTIVNYSSTLYVHDEVAESGKILLKADGSLKIFDCNDFSVKLVSGNEDFISDYVQIKYFHNKYDDSLYYIYKGRLLKINLVTFSIDVVSDIGLSVFNSDPVFKFYNDIIYFTSYTITSQNNKSPLYVFKDDVLSIIEVAGDNFHTTFDFLIDESSSERFAVGVSKKIFDRDGYNEFSKIFYLDTKTSELKITNNFVSNQWPVNKGSKNENLAYIGNLPNFIAEIVILYPECLFGVSCVQARAHNNSPQIDDSFTLYYARNHTITMPFRAQDGDFDKLVYELEGQPTWLTIDSNGVIRGEVPNDSKGISPNINVTVTDEAGNRVSQSISIVIIDAIIDPTPPTPPTPPIQPTSDGEGGGVISPLLFLYLLVLAFFRHKLQIRKLSSKKRSTIYMDSLG
jgi:hypothetical protein